MYVTKLNVCGVENLPENVRQGGRKGCRSNVQVDPITVLGDIGAILYRERELEPGGDPVPSSAAALNNLYFIFHKISHIRSAAALIILNSFILHQKLSQEI